MTWGPFLPNLDPAERKARLRSLRALVKVMTGPRGNLVALAALRAEVSGGDAELLVDTEAEFNRLTALDRRRVMSAYLAVA